MAQQQGMGRVYTYSIHMNSLILNTGGLARGRPADGDRRRSGGRLTRRGRALEGLTGRGCSPGRAAPGKPRAGGPPADLVQRSRVKEGCRQIWRRRRPTVGLGQRTGGATARLGPRPATEMRKWGGGHGPRAADGGHEGRVVGGDGAAGLQLERRDRVCPLVW